MSSSTFYIAIDPGLATGVAAFSLDAGGEPFLIETGELGVREVAPWVRKWLDVDPEVNVIVERFTINSETHKKSPAHWSLELIGIIKQCMWDIGRSEEEIRLQQPADAKNLFPNPALKKLGYWHRGGEGHALDAIRHALLGMVSYGVWQPTRLLK